MNRGFWAVVTAFFIWGLMPAYLKLLETVPATQIVAHRLIWCCVFALIWLAVIGRLGGVRAALMNPAVRWRLLGSATLICLNWLVYVWAVTHGHVIEASLGYFINPLVNVVLGVAVLGERLSRAQWVAVALAALAVIWLTWSAGAPPWIALVLALAFSSYGLIRKTVAVEAVAGLAAETLLVAPLGLAFLLWMNHSGQGAFAHDGWSMSLLLVGAGVITAIPLMLFAFGARRIRYSTVGLIQYLQPTMQLLVGIFLYRELFTRADLIGFSLIWAALMIYAAEGLRRQRQVAQMPVEIG